MQEVTLSIPVKTNTSMAPGEIAAIVQRLIAIGLADAEATLEDGGNCDAGDVDAAQLAVSLEIGDPIVAEKMSPADEAYVAASGCKCPACGSLAIEGGFVEVAGRSAHQSVHCQSCDSTWSDVYALKGYSDLEDNRQEAENADG